MNIGIYGGSFNPIHYGHLNVARQAIADLQLDKLIVIPANVSPFKVDATLRDGDRMESTVLPFPDRLETVRAVFSDMENVIVDDRELKRGGVSYTIDTVREIRKEYACDSLYYIIGEDSVEGLSRWRNVDELKEMVSFKAYPRTKESSTEIRELFERAGVTVNPDERLATAVRAGVVRKNGFCPCRLPKNPEYFCPCDEFKDQIRDPSYHGLCHCRLYLKP